MGPDFERDRLDDSVVEEDTVAVAALADAAVVDVIVVVVDGIGEAVVHAVAVEIVVVGMRSRFDFGVGDFVDFAL